MHYLFICKKFEMLTYSLSFDRVTISPLKKIVAAQFAKFFWNSYFRYEDLWEITRKNFCTEAMNNYEEFLTHCMEKTISASNSFIEKYKLPTGFKPILRESIVSFHRAFREFLQWKVRHESNEIVELFIMEKEGRYAQNYISVEGEFNDLLLIKHFVLNSKYSVGDRFRLACLYCLESEIATLWPKVKMSDPHFFRGDLDKILQFEKEELVTFWIFQLEGQFEAMAEANEYEENFWEAGLTAATSWSETRQYPHAVYFFWQNISDSKKTSIIENGNFFELMEMFEDFRDDKMNYILYSLLSKEQKKNLFDWTVMNEKPGAWISLLRTSYNKSMFSEILEFVYRLPYDMYSDALSFLMRDIKSFKLPHLTDMFNVLWNRLSVEQQVHRALADDRCFEILIEAKLFHCLEHIIKSFPHHDKVWCLFYGPNIANLLSERSEFELLEKYLSIFLFERDPTTRKETLRKDASSILQKFLESSRLKVPSAVEEEVKNRIENLQTSVALLDELSEKVSEESQHTKIFGDHSHQNPNSKTSEKELAFISRSKKRKREETL